MEEKLETNKAPERLYLSKNIYSTYLYQVPDPDDETAVEYTNTDAFIEKAVKWIEEINNHHHIMRYSDSCELPLSELTEWFRNYMKGE